MSLSTRYVALATARILATMPKLWTDTIEAHRAAVRDATVEAIAALVAELGLRAVTMSKIAEVTGIGRATLYKYFPDVEAILLAWHQREVIGHLQQLAEARDQATDPRTRLEATMTAYARIAHLSRGRHEAELAAVLHRDEHVARADHQVAAMLQELLNDAAAIGAVRTDVSTRELASFCLHALAAAENLPSQGAVERLVMLTMSGLHPGSSGSNASK